MSQDLVAFKQEINEEFTELIRVELPNVSIPVDEKFLKKKSLILEMTKFMKAKVRTDEVMVRMKSIGQKLSKFNVHV